jgi:hypothetical protein
MNDGVLPAGPGRPDDPAEWTPDAEEPFVPEEDAYSAVEEDEVAARLEALGYLD